MVSTTVWHSRSLCLIFLVWTPRLNFSLALLCNSSSSIVICLLFSSIVRASLSFYSLLSNNYCYRWSLSASNSAILAFRLSTSRRSSSIRRSRSCNSAFSSLISSSFLRRVSLNSSHSMHFFSYRSMYFSFSAVSSARAVLVRSSSFYTTPTS